MKGIAKQTLPPLPGQRNRFIGFAVHMHENRVIQADSLSDEFLQNRCVLWQMMQKKAMLNSHRREDV